MLEGGQWSPREIQLQGPWSLSQPLPRSEGLGCLPTAHSGVEGASTPAETPGCWEAMPAMPAMGSCSAWWARTVSAAGPRARGIQDIKLPFHIGSLTQGHYFTQNFNNLNILFL